MEQIGIIGTGRLGICLALNLERAGYQVKAVDVDPQRVADIDGKKLEVDEPMVKEYLMEAKNLSVSTAVDTLASVDFIFLCVPTPSLPNGKYDHSYLWQCAEALLTLPQPAHWVDVVVNATTMPGFCHELAARLEAHRYRVSYNPEFIAQGSIIRDQQFPDQVLIGEADSEAGDRIAAVYARICKNSPAIHRMDRTSAEITKLSVNCFLTTKIAFANAIGDLCHQLGADHQRVLGSIGADSRIGHAFLAYGYGFGGPCLPRDNRALGIAGKEAGLEILLSEATDKANALHLEFQFAQLLEREEPLVFEYLTYKQGTDILEESQRLALAVKLAQAGKKVIVRESAKTSEEIKARFGDLFIYETYAAL
jgi:nucleotide sugar dehydrogenase